MSVTDTASMKERGAPEDMKGDNSLQTGLTLTIHSTSTACKTMLSNSLMLLLSLNFEDMLNNIGLGMGE